MNLIWLTLKQPWNQQDREKLAHCVWYWIRLSLAPPWWALTFAAWQLKMQIKGFSLIRSAFSCPSSLPKSQLANYMSCIVFEHFRFITTVFRRSKLHPRCKMGSDKVSYLLLKRRKCIFGNTTYYMQIDNAVLLLGNPWAARPDGQSRNLLAPHARNLSWGAHPHDDYLAFAICRLHMQKSTWFDTRLPLSNKGIQAWLQSENFPNSISL